MGVDYGEPLGLLHESAYIPMKDWRARVAPKAHGPKPPEHPDPLLLGLRPAWRLILLSLPLADAKPVIVTRLDADIITSAAARGPPAAASTLV
jgi:hypothetical protein